MTDTSFKLATVQTQGLPFVLLVVGDQGWALDGLYRAWRQGRRGGAIVGANSIRQLLDDWEPNFEALCAMAEFAAGGNAPPELIIDEGSISFCHRSSILEK